MHDHKYVTAVQSFSNSVAALRTFLHSHMRGVMQSTCFSNQALRKRRWLSCVAVADLLKNTLIPFAPAAADERGTASPIKHVIVIIGENRSFDHVFATYKPRPGQSVFNLLSQGIINEDGSPGPNFV